MISYFTDGSAAPTNPGPGGFAVIRDGQPYLVGSEYEGSPVDISATTNIRMEAQAIMAALTDADGQPCTITTDSQFWINVLIKWAPVWQRNSWKKKSGEIKNLDLVKPLFELYQQSQAKLVWTAAHVGTELNEMADQWANRARAAQVHGVIRADVLQLNA